MTGDLTLLKSSTANADTSYTMLANDWQVNDAVVVVIHDTVQGGSCSVARNTSGTATTWTTEDGGSNATFNGGSGNFDERSDTSYGNPEFVTAWSVRFDVLSVGTNMGTVTITYAGSSGGRRYSVWRLRPDSGKTLPGRSTRLRLHQQKTGGASGANAEDSFSMTGSAIGSHDAAALVAAYTANSMASNPNYDADGDGTYEVGSTAWTTSATATITTASWSATVATYTTSAAHGFTRGQTVTVTGVTPSGYNVTAVVNSVPSSTQFTLVIASNPGTYTSGGSATGVQGYNNSGCVGFGRFYASGASNSPGTTEKIKYVSNPSNTGVKAALIVVYLAEVPSVSGSASVATTATVSATGHATHYASATIAITTTIQPSSDKLGQAAIATALSIAATGYAKHYGTAAITTLTSVIPSGETSRLGYINRHAFDISSAAGDQSLGPVAVYLGDLVALLMSTADGTGYADLYPTNCTLKYFGPNYTAAITTLSTASWSGGTITYTTTTAHSLQVGQRVTISGASPSGYNQTNVAVASVPTSTTFTVSASNPGTYTSGGTVTGAIPFDNTTWARAEDDATNTIYARIWFAKVTAVSGTPTVSCTLRASTPGRNTLVSISPGAGNYFRDDDTVLDSGVLLRDANDKRLVPWEDTTDWPINRGLGMLFVARYTGGPRGCDLDFNADGTFDLSHGTATSNNGPGGGGDLQGIHFGSPQTVWAADAYYAYPGIARPSPDNGIFHDPDGSGNVAIATLLIQTHRTFETVTEIDEAQPIDYIKGYALGTAVEKDFYLANVVGQPSNGVRGSYGIYFMVGNAVNWTRELDEARPLVIQKSRSIIFGLGNPGPGPFRGYELKAWAYKVGSGDVGDIRLTLLDGSTELYVSSWFPLTGTESPYSLPIDTVAARSTLRCRIDARAFGTAFTPAITAISFAATGGLGTAIELDGTESAGVRVRIAGQDFIVNKIQMG